MATIVVSITLSLSTQGKADAQAPSLSMNLEWWHPFAAGAGVATLFLIDEPVRDFLQDHRSDGLNDLGDVTTHFMDPEKCFGSRAAAPSRSA